MNNTTTKPLNQNRMEAVVKWLFSLDEGQAFSAGMLFGIGFGVLLSVLFYFHKKWKDYYKH